MGVLQFSGGSHFILTFSLYCIPATRGNLGKQSAGPHNGRVGAFGAGVEGWILLHVYFSYLYSRQADIRTDFSAQLLNSACLPSSCLGRS